MSKTPKLLIDINIRYEDGTELFKASGIRFGDYEEVKKMCIANQKMYDNLQTTNEPTNNREE